MFERCTLAVLDLRIFGATKAVADQHRIMNITTLRLDGDPQSS
jgi:hypothetical protein